MAVCECASARMCECANVRMCECTPHSDIHEEVLHAARLTAKVESERVVGSLRVDRRAVEEIPALARPVAGVRERGLRVVDRRVGQYGSGRRQRDKLS